MKQQENWKDYTGSGHEENKYSPYRMTTEAQKYITLESEH
jgi:hypothetical protein